MPKREGGTIRQVLANDAATLVYLAGQNAVALHVWTSRADRLERPDRLVFDLDPTVQDFAEVRAAAREAGELLRDIGLVPYTMTTGSRGLHVVAPLQRRADYEEVHEFGRAVADRLASEHPDRLTSEFRREKRGDRIYLDMNRNAYGQHAIAAYSPRALPNAPVATPLEWDELDDPKLDPQGWSITTVLERLADRGGRSVGRDRPRRPRARRPPQGPGLAARLRDPSGVGESLVPDAVDRPHGGDVGRARARRVTRGRDLRHLGRRHDAGLLLRDAARPRVAAARRPSPTSCAGPISRR